MGRATILSGGDDGRYTISFDIGEAARAAKVAAYTAAIAEIDARIVVAQAAYDAAQVAVEAAASALDAAVAACVAASAGGIAAVIDSAVRGHQQAAFALAFAQGQAATRSRNLNGLKLVKVRATAQRSALLALTLTESRQAWCVDLTEDAAGDVATVEIPGESDLMLIAPGGRPWVAADGLLASRALQSAEQAFFNAALLPGWQKFMPTYRWGTITAIDDEADTANVTLGSATSSAQSLDVNQGTTLVDVPVEYMTCNAVAFEVGDQVVVQFVGGDWSSPKVIGFLDNPKYCGNWRVWVSLIGTGIPNLAAVVGFKANSTEYAATVYTLANSDELTVEYRINRGGWVATTRSISFGSVNYYAEASGYNAIFVISTFFGSGHDIGFWVPEDIVSPGQFLEIRALHGAALKFNAAIQHPNDVPPIPVALVGVITGQDGGSTSRADYDLFERTGD